MKTNLFTMSLVSVVLFACGGRTNDDPGGIVGVSGVAGSANSIAGASSLEPDTSSTGGSSEVSTGGASSTGGSSMIATGGTPEPLCVPEVQVRYLSHGSANVEPGAQDVATLKFQLTATCINQEVEELDAHISAPGYDTSSLIPFRSANGENFQDIKVLDLAGGNVVAGPILSKDYTSNEKAHLTFKDSFTLLKDTPKILEIRVDVSSTFLTDSRKNLYTVYFNGINIRNGGNVPIVTSYADGFDGANWPSFTVTSGSCRLQKTIPLSVYTTYNDLVGTSDGVIVHGNSKSSDGSSVNSSEIQFWDPRTQTMDGSMLVGIESNLLLESGSDQGFMAMINSPQGPERFPGDFAPLSLSFFDTKGVFQKNASIWSTAPRNVTAVTGSKEQRVIWIDDKTDFENPTIQSWTPFIDSKPNGNSIKTYVWPADRTRPMFFPTNAVTNGQKTAAGVSYACAVINPDSDCYVYNSILVWSDAQTSPADTTRLFFTGNLMGLYASQEGFDAIIGEQGSMYVSKYDWNGQPLRRVNLPANSRRVTAFRGGYAVITTSPDSLKDFEFILVDANGTIKQTIPFQSDFDRYELALGNLVVSGTETLAFSWSGLGQTTSSTLAFFNCQ